jgi:hypothetical protein
MSKHSARPYEPAADHPWRLAGVETFGTEALLKVFQYNPTPTLSQLLMAGGGEANYNTAIAQLLSEGAIEVFSKQPTRYRLKEMS